MLWLHLFLVGGAAGAAVWLGAAYGAAATAGAVGGAWLLGRGVTWYTRRGSSGRDVSFATPEPSSFATAEPSTTHAGEEALVRRIEHQSQVAAEVELAATVQQAFIPDGRPRGLGPVELAGSFVPASRTGGDWWAAYELPGGSTLVLVADVTGHGIGAARITAAARGAYDASLRLAAGKASMMDDLMIALDAAVRRVGMGHYNMTCFAAIIEPSRRVRFTSAGHVAPYVARHSADGKVTIDALVGRGNPLGIAAGPPELRVFTETLREGDLVIFYSDGLIDCISPTGERFGDRRMQRLLRDIVPSNFDIGTVRDRIETAARDFTGGTQQPDDITFVAARIR